MGIISVEEDSLKHARIVAKLLDLMHEYEDLQITLIKDDFKALIDELGTNISDSNIEEITVKASQIVIEQPDPDNDKEQSARRLPWYSKIRDFLLDAADDDSKQNKAIKGASRGIKLIQEIARKYNSIAQWVGLMQVPNIFL